MSKTDDLFEKAVKATTLNRKRPAWYTWCRWTIEAKTSSGWKEFYCASTKKEARARKRDVEEGTKDADGRIGKTHLARIVPGAGHKTRRGF